MADQTIVCRDCSTPFTFTDNEQNFYKEKNLHAPRRCTACRRKRRDVKDGKTTGDRQFYAAVCNQCGQDCTVPFIPREGKPVYCKPCHVSRQNKGG